MNALLAHPPTDEELAAGDPRAPSLSDLKLPDVETYNRLKRWAKSPNIAMIGRTVDGDGNLSETDEGAEISDEMLQRIGMRCKREYDIDWNSCAEWREKTDQAMKLAMQIAEPKNYPWPKASNVIYPLMTTAAFQFAARAYPGMIPGKNVVKGLVIGDDKGVPAPAQVSQGLGQPGQGLTSPAPPSGPSAPAPANPNGQGWLIPPGAKQARADRVAEHMSYQLLDEQKEWEHEMDTLLHVLPITGCEFKKSFFDADAGHNVSLRVSAQNLVVNYKAKSLERAPRLTEEVQYYPLEVEEMEMAGTFRPISYTASEDGGDDEDAPRNFLEQHRWIDLDDDGYREPYIVTLHKESAQVVRIVARYEIDGIKWNATKGRIQKIEPVHYYTQYDFFPNLEGGIYGTGFGQLLRPINESINTTLNMMFDAEHLKTAGGGFVGKNLSMNAGAIRFQLGEYKAVNTNGQAIRDSILPLPAPGASPMLFELLGYLTEAGKEVSGIKDVLTGQTVPANLPATTMLAMIEQGLKQYTGILKRVFRSFKDELDKLYRLNRLYLDQEASYKVGDVWKTITRADYEKGSGVAPIGDPTMATDMQKLGRAQFLESMLGDPLMDHKEIRLRQLDAAQIPDADKLFVDNPPPNPAVVKTMMELQLAKQKLDVEQQHEEASLQLRARHDMALIEKEQANALLARAQAINQIAQADKAVQEAGVEWSAHQLDIIKAQMDAFASLATAGTAANVDPETTTPGTPEASQ